MKKICTTLILFVIILNAQSQNLTLQDNLQESPIDRIVHIFENIDLLEASTNILLEHGLPLLDLNHYDGNTVAPPLCNSITFGMAYATLQSGAVNAVSVLPDPLVAYGNEVNALSSTDPVPFGVIHYDYNYLDPNAITNGIATVNNDQLNYGPNHNNNLFMEDRTFWQVPLPTLVPYNCPLKKKSLYLISLVI